MVELAANGGFDVHGAVTRTYPLAEADAAYRDLADGKITGRAIVVMPWVSDDHHKESERGQDEH